MVRRFLTWLLCWLAPYETEYERRRRAQRTTDGRNL